MDIEVWLRGLGLQQYQEAFLANDIDAEVLPRLTAEDLIGLGVTSIGHRRKLLHAIALLQEAPAPAAKETRATTLLPVEAERRQLTVMFVDLVGSTELSVRLDPEDLREVMRAYQAACAGVIARFEGHVAKFLGDGVLAYFGWPQAHEDDAERAVRAGLATVEEIGQLPVGAKTRLAARIGIATGQVIVGDLTSQDAADRDSVVGETPNLAARLQTLAEPGTVVISQATRKLIGGLFEIDDLGPKRLKGFAEPLAVWRVSTESRTESRFEALHGKRLTPLVGREHEIALLLERWAQAKNRDGQVVLLDGEPGIGKSRIAQTLCERLGEGPHVRLRYFCSPYHTNSALHPVLDQLGRAAGFAVDEPLEARLAKLDAILRENARDAREAVALLASLFSIPIGARYPELNLSPQRQKQRTLEVLVEQLEGLAARQPVLMIFEDAHWLDPTTFELLDLTVKRIARLPVLLLITFRPELTLPWTNHAPLTQMSLDRLSHGQVGTMVERLTGGKALPAGVLEQIVARTDGVPLFVEELTKTVLESGLLTDAGDRFDLAGPLSPLAIPTTLHDSLMARLDRLATVKQVAQVGAVIGREFSYQLLKAVVELSTAELREALTRLVASELVFCGGSPPHANYSFKHALVRDVAYESILKAKRRQLHARIAATLEQMFPTRAQVEPLLLMHHYAQAGLVGPAIGYGLKASQSALRRSAIEETLGILRHGLALVEKLPDGDERTQAGAAHYALLGLCSALTRGYGSDEAARSYAQALELCQQVDTSPHLAPVLYGLFTFHWQRGDFPLARRLGEQLLEIGERMEDATLLVASHGILGSVLWYMADLQRADTHLEAAISGYCKDLHAELVASYGHDLGVFSLIFASYSRAVLGYPERSLKAIDDAVELARDLEHPFSLCLALAASLPILVTFQRHDRRRVRAWAEECIAVATEQGFPHWHAMATMHHAWALDPEQRARKGMALFEEGMARWRRAGANQAWGWFYSLLAEMHLAVDQPELALGACKEARSGIERNGEHVFEALVLEIAGRALRALGRVGDAERAFTDALANARRQQARTWELRAATGLAWLWAERGERQKAYDLLAPIYGWFTEGFDTADLKDARALLDELC
jgi:class 3 adenylate cyclase/tetratricopeptide (TPR) repeat protein